MQIRMLKKNKKNMFSNTNISVPNQFFKNTLRNLFYMKAENVNSGKHNNLLSFFWIFNDFFFFNLLKFLWNFHWKSRCFVLIATTKPLLVLFHHGFIKLSLDKYKIDKEVEDKKKKFMHLVNLHIQKKHPNYAKDKEKTTLDMDSFEVC